MREAGYEGTCKKEYGKETKTFCLQYILLGDKTRDRRLL
jgi:hypothetical protein